MAIKLITFDLDDTLWNPAPALQRAEQVCFDWLAAECPQLTSLYDLASFRQYRVDLATSYPELAQRISELRIEAMRRAIMQTGLTREQAAELAQAAFDVFYQQRSQLELFEHTLPLLQSLSARLPLIAVTNGNADLKLAGVDQYFTACVTADDVGVAKPAPDMFHAALQQAGVSPEQCIHVGDHAHNDVHAARLLGIHAIWTPLYQQSWPDELAAPEHQVDCLSALDDLIRAIEARH